MGVCFVTEGAIFLSSNYDWHLKMFREKKREKVIKRWINAKQKCWFEEETSWSREEQCVVWFNDNNNNNEQKLGKTRNNREGGILSRRHHHHNIRPASFRKKPGDQRGIEAKYSSYLAQGRLTQCIAASTLYSSIGARVVSAAIDEELASTAHRLRLPAKVRHRRRVLYKITRGF